MGRKEYEEEKKKTIASFVQDGTVDWKRWDELRGSEGSYNGEIKEGVISHLMDIGILSFTSEGNHRVRGCGLSLNPRLSICQTYFTSRDQASSYANALFSGAHYEVRIEKLSDIEMIKREN